MKQELKILQLEREIKQLKKQKTPKNLLDGDLGALATIAAVFGVVKLGQSLSK